MDLSSVKDVVAESRRPVGADTCFHGELPSGAGEANAIVHFGPTSSFLPGKSRYPNRVKTCDAPGVSGANAGFN